MPADRAPQVGDLLAGYRIESMLGRGGMGVVYLATHEQLARKAALKVLIPELAEDEDFRSRFIRESQLAASLEHPHVIPIYDAAEVDGVLFIAMRYVEGDDLRDLLKREGSLSPERTLEIVSQVAGALDVAHAKALVHRDVKPANILIESESGSAFLSDFGVAKSQGQTGFTRTGSFLGSVDYCPPEQIEGKALDGRADVYGLGCVLYHCLAGQPPYVRETEIAVINAHLNDPIPALSTIAPDLPSELDGVIVTAMAKHPEVRYQTAGELAGALRTALLGASSDQSTAATIPAPIFASAPTVASPTGLAAPPPSTPPVERRSRRTWLVAVGVAALIVMVGVGAAAMLSRPDGTPAGTLQTGSALSSDVSRQLASVVGTQEAVTTLVAELRSSQESFSSLRSAGRRLERVAIRTEGGVQALEAESANERTLRRSVLVALRRQSEYAETLAGLPAPGSFTKARAMAIIGKADRAEAAYASVDRGAEPPCCPAMPVRAGATRHLLSVADTASSDRAPSATRTIELTPYLVGPSPDDPPWRGRCFGPYSSRASVKVGGITYRSDFIQCGDYSGGDPTRATGTYRFAETRLPLGTRLLEFRGVGLIDELSSSSQQGSSVSWTVYYRGRALCSDGITWVAPRPTPTTLTCDARSVPSDFDLTKLRIEQRASLTSGGSFWAGFLHPHVRVSTRG